VRKVALPDGRVWLRVADPAWREPLDPTYAGQRGGRWNPPVGFRTLYLNADVATARLQLERLFAGSPVRTEDLAGDAFVLVAARLPRNQTCADLVSATGVAAAGLPATYPADARGRILPHDATRAVGTRVHAARLRGVWCRSACTADGRGRELAWFPATARSRARPVWRKPVPLAAWRDAARWADLGLPDMRDPAATD
jgi:hypothetical protein